MAGFAPFGIQGRSLDDIRAGAIDQINNHIVWLFNFSDVNVLISMHKRRCNHEVLFPGRAWAIKIFTNELEDGFCVE
jgi:hypothetical protein